MRSDVKLDMQHELSACIVFSNVLFYCLVRLWANSCPSNKIKRIKSSANLMNWDYA